MLRHSAEQRVPQPPPLLFPQTARYPAAAATPAAAAAAAAAASPAAAAAAAASPAAAAAASPAAAARVPPQVPAFPQVPALPIRGPRPFPLLPSFSFVRPPPTDWTRTPFPMPPPSKVASPAPAPPLQPSPAVPLGAENTHQCVEPFGVDFNAKKLVKSAAGTSFYLDGIQYREDFKNAIERYRDPEEKAGEKSTVGRIFYGYVLTWILDGKPSMYRGGYYDTIREAFVATCEEVDRTRATGKSVQAATLCACAGVSPFEIKNFEEAHPSGVPPTTYCVRTPIEDERIKYEFYVAPEKHIPEPTILPIGYCQLPLFAVNQQYFDFSGSGAKGRRLPDGNSIKLGAHIVRPTDAEMKNCEDSTERILGSVSGGRPGAILSGNTPHDESEYKNMWISMFSDQALTNRVKSTVDLPWFCLSLNAADMHKASTLVTLMQYTYYSGNAKMRVETRVFSGEEKITGMSVAFASTKATTPRSGVVDTPRTTDNCNVAWLYVDETSNITGLKTSVRNHMLESITRLDSISGNSRPWVILGPSDVDKSRTDKPYYERDIANVNYNVGVGEGSLRCRLSVVVHPAVQIILDAASGASSMAGAFDYIDEALRGTDGVLLPLTTAGRTVVAISLSDERQYAKGPHALDRICPTETVFDIALSVGVLDKLAASSDDGWAKIAEAHGMLLGYAIEEARKRDSASRIGTWSLLKTAAAHENALGYELVLDNVVSRLSPRHKAHEIAEGVATIVSAGLHVGTSGPWFSLLEKTLALLIPEVYQSAASDAIFADVAYIPKPHLTDTTVHSVLCAVMRCNAVSCMNYIDAACSYVDDARPLTFHPFARENVERAIWETFRSGEENDRVEPKQMENFIDNLEKIIDGRLGSVLTAVKDDSFSVYAGPITQDGIITRISLDFGRVLLRALVREAHAAIAEKRDVFAALTAVLAKEFGFLAEQERDILSVEERKLVDYVRNVAEQLAATGNFDDAIRSIDEIETVLTVAEWVRANLSGSIAKSFHARLMRVVKKKSIPGIVAALRSGMTIDELFDLSLCGTNTEQIPWEDGVGLFSYVFEKLPALPFITDRTLAMLMMRSTFDYDTFDPEGKFLYADKDRSRVCYEALKIVLTEKVFLVEKAAMISEDACTKYFGTKVLGGVTEWEERSPGPVDLMKFLFMVGRKYDKNTFVLYPSAIASRKHVPVEIKKIEDQSKASYDAEAFNSMDIAHSRDDRRRRALLEKRRDVETIPEEEMARLKQRVEAASAPVEQKPTVSEKKPTIRRKRPPEKSKGKKKEEEGPQQKPPTKRRKKPAAAEGDLCERSLFRRQYATSFPADCINGKSMLDIAGAYAHCLLRFALLVYRGSGPEAQSPQMRENTREAMKNLEAAQLCFVEATYGEDEKIRMYIGHMDWICEAYVLLHEYIARRLGDDNAKTAFRQVLKQDNKKFQAIVLETLYKMKDAIEVRYNDTQLIAQKIGRQIDRKIAPRVGSQEWDALTGLPEFNKNIAQITAWKLTLPISDATILDDLKYSGSRGGKWPYTRQDYHYLNRFKETRGGSQYCDWLKTHTSAKGARPEFLAPISSDDVDRIRSESTEMLRSMAEKRSSRTNFGATTRSSEDESSSLEGESSSHSSPSEGESAQTEEEEGEGEEPPSAASAAAAATPQVQSSRGVVRTESLVGEDAGDVGEDAEDVFSRNASLWYGEEPYEEQPSSEGTDSEVGCPNSGCSTLERARIEASMRMCLCKKPANCACSVCRKTFCGADCFRKHACR